MVNNAEPLSFGLGLDGAGGLWFGISNTIKPIPDAG